MALYGPGGPFGIDVAFTRIGILMALLFVTLPFVVRAVQPVLIELDEEMEDAAASLGARPIGVFRKIVFPNLLPAVLSGVALAFARAVGEFGAVVLISGNIPFKTEVSSVYIFGQLQSGNGERRGGGVGAAARDLPRRAAGDRRLPPLEDEARPCLDTSLRFGVLGYLALILLVPVGFVFYRAFEHGFAHAWHAVTTPEALHALWLTLLMAAIACR